MSRYPAAASNLSSTSLLLADRGPALGQSGPSSGLNGPEPIASPQELAARRAAGRANALKTSKAEKDALLRERRLLVDRELDGKITKDEQRRLTYIRWTLDRIEDAEHGSVLDALEAAVEQYEKQRSLIEDLIAQLDRAAKTSK